MEAKGFCLDDTTFSGCSEDLVGLWPHTNEEVKSIRLFKGWNPEWGGDDVRDKAWANLVKWVKTNNAKVFIGTAVSCDKAGDEEDWAMVQKLMKLLGPEHVLGVGLGNEMDIMWRWPGVTQECLTELWGTTPGTSRYFKLMQERTKDMDAAGFKDAAITVVWAMSALAGSPFKNDNQAKVNDLVTQAYNKYKKRWIWTFNVYAIWDASLPLDPGSKNKCDGTIAAAADGTYNKNILVAVRKRIKLITGNSDDPLWIGETGWSSPCPSGNPMPLMAACPDFCSKDTFKQIYSGFLSWDLGIEGAKDAGDFKGADRAFYFAMRDSTNMGATESFGLVGTCTSGSCKLQQKDEAAKDADELVV